MKTVLSPSTRSFMIAFALLGFAAILFACDDALAQQAATNFGEVQQSVGRNIAKVPKFIAVLCYVIGAFFAADGLLKLKAWMEDSAKNPLNAAIFRLLVSALLIYLPYGIILVNSTVFGSEASQGAIPKTPPPKLKVF